MPFTIIKNRSVVKDNSLLFQKLESLKAYKKSRTDLATWVLEKPEHLKELIGFCFQESSPVSYKAAWVLEQVVLKDKNLLVPYINTFFYSLPKITQEPAVRSFAKICEILAEDFYKTKNSTIKFSLQPQHREAMVAICFDWIISGKKVACQAYAMQCLYLLGTEFSWVHPELKALLEQNYARQQAAFQARAKHILKKLAHKKN